MKAIVFLPPNATKKKLFQLIYMNCCLKSGNSSFMIFFSSFFLCGIIWNASNVFTDVLNFLSWTSFEFAWFWLIKYVIHKSLEQRTVCVCRSFRQKKILEELNWNLVHRCFLIGPIVREIYTYLKKIEYIIWLMNAFQNSLFFLLRSLTVCQPV